MLDSLFKGLFDSPTASVISVTDFLICLGAALVIGVIMALSYMYKTRYTKSFVVTLALLPSVVCVVIMMVNGNVGTGVAVAGAFSLVRFRSAPGTAKEICTLFLAMGAGLIVGMGYVGYAFLFTVIMCVVFLFYSHINISKGKNAACYKTVNITIPEGRDYTNVFEDVFEEYCAEYEVIKVKTVNLGSMFRITYNIRLKSTDVEKKMIDDLRIRNGNLEITVSKQETVAYEL